MSYTLVLARWIRLIATDLGLLAIFLPLIRLWLNRSVPFSKVTEKRISLSRWSGVFVVTIIYLAIGILLWKPILLEISPFLRLFMVVTGSFLYFPGIILYLWGYQALGSMYGVSSATGAHLYEKHQLIERGPYSFVRHPMYLGVILVAIGALLLFRT